MSQADAFRNAMQQQQFYNLAGSPLLLEIMSRLRIESIIDEHAPPRTRQAVSHGQSGLALLLTRLLQPKALYKVADWLSGTGVDIVLDHEGDAFTDVSVQGVNAPKSKTLFYNSTGAVRPSRRADIAS